MQKLFTSLLFVVLACSAQVAQAQLEDLTVSSASSPVSGCGFTGTVPVSVIVNNVGTMGAFGGFTMAYDYYHDGNFFTGGSEFEGDAPGEVGDVIPGTPYPFTFADPINISLPGTYEIVVYVSFSTDLNQVNDTLTFTITNYGFPITVSGDPMTPYFEDFEGPNTWSAKGTNSSWALGDPTAKPVIDTAYSGVNAWVTSLTGQHNSNELSMVESPCFDFTNLDNPEIEMAVWWSSQTSFDGAKLQSSIDAGLTWQDVGGFGGLNDSINWYTDNTISALPNPQVGWTGTLNNSSGGWVIARHDLTDLENQPSVKLRVLFGSNASSNSDGFAFDNVTIREKIPHDIVLLNYQPFGQGCGLGTAEHITVNFFNNGTQTLHPTDFNLSYTFTNIPGHTAVVEPYAGDSIQPYTYGSYTFAATEDLSVAATFDISMNILFGDDYDVTTNSKNSIIYNSVVSASPTPNIIDFEDGAVTLNLFSTEERTRSRVLVNTAHSYEGTYAMVLDGAPQGLGWSEFDALTNPWGPNSNTQYFSKAVLCVKIPDSLATMKLSFYLKQLYHQSFLNTNFRLTVNGQPIPFTRDGVQFTPTGNQKALRPPVTPDATTNQWQFIEANIHPYIDLSDTTQVSVQIGFESSVRLTYDAVNATTGTANIIDTIRVETTKLPPVGLPENLLNQQLSVYPNPSTGLFNVDLSQAAHGTYTFEVTDLTGKLITRETARLSGQPSVTIDLADQPKGVYILKVASDKNVAARKIVVQ